MWNLSIKANVKQFQELKLGFKSITFWNKYQLKVLTQTRNQYLDYLIDPSLKKMHTE